MEARERAWRELRRRKAELVLLGAWIGVVAVNAAVGRGFTSDLHLLHAVNMAFMVVLGVYYAAQPDRQFERVLALGLTLLGLEVLRSLPTLWMEPGIARLSMQVFEVREELKEDAIIAGVEQYGFYIALAIILPRLVPPLPPSRRDQWRPCWSWGNSCKPSRCSRTIWRWRMGMSG